MKRITVPVPSVPLLIGLVFAMFLALLTSSFTSSAATPFGVQAVDPTVIIGCVGNSNLGNSSLSLGGRAITASTILRVDPYGTCAANESALTWNVQGPQGIQGPQGTQGPTGPTGPQGPKGDPTFTHTFVITTTADAVNNGNRLLSVITTISNTNPKVTESYNLVKLEPGNYDLGSNSLTLPYGVNLEGSGQDVTIITSSAGSATSLTTGVINIMDRYSAVRDLTVDNLGLAKYSAGIYSDGVFAKISDINIYAGCSGGPTCDVTPPNEVYSVYLGSHSTTKIQNAFINTNASRSMTTIGIYNLGNLEIQNSSVIAVSGNNTIGIKVGGIDSSFDQTLIEQTTVQAQWGGVNTAIYVEGPITQVKNSTLAGYSSANSQSTAIYNNSNDTTVQNSTMKVLVSTNGTPNNAITNISTLKVGNSQIDGTVSNSGTLKCVASYNADYDPITDVNACS